MIIIITLEISTVVLTPEQVQYCALTLPSTVSSPNNSDESVHADVSGAFVQSENASGHLCVCQREASCSPQVCAFVWLQPSMASPPPSSTLSSRTNRWETSVPGEATTREYRNSDGTFTVQSDYILVPSRETHKETLTCVTTYNEEVFTDSVTLDIQCKQEST